MSGAAPPGSEGASRPGANLAPAPDVQAVVAELQDEVARNRTAGAYPASLIEKLDSPFHPDEGLEPPEAHVVVESARPLRSTRPVVGAVTVFCKRVQRRLLSWYVAPIAQDQNRFNLAILRELRAIEQRVARLEGSPAAPPDEPDTESPRQGGS
jgi:hypothetical protein